MSEPIVHDEFELDLPSEEEQLSAIAQSIRFAKDFAVIVAVCNDAELRDRLIQRLALRLPGVSGRTARVMRGDDSLVPFLEEAGSGAYLNVIGMGDIVPAGTEGENHPLVASLNANRNALPSLYRGVVILWVPAFLAAAIHRGAPDFFSIRSGLYRFAVSAGELEEQAAELEGLPLQEMRLLKPEDREERISRLLSLIQEIDDRSSAEAGWTLARLYSQLGDAYLSRTFGRGASGLAFEAWNQAEILYQKAGDPLGQANVLRSRGDLHYREGRGDQAIQAWNQAEILFQKAGDPLGQANVLRRRGDLHYREGRGDQAIQAWNQAEILYQKAGDPLGQANVLKSRGDLHYREGRSDQAIEAWNQAEILYQKAGGPLGQANVLKSRGDLHYREGRGDQAIQAWNQAEILFQKAGDPLGQANVLKSRGLQALSNNQDPAARDFFGRAQELYAMQNMALQVGEMHAHLSRTCPPESPEAIHHRAEAERIWREIGREDLIPEYFPTD